MKLFADSGFIIGLIHERDDYHDIASAIWNELIENRIISGYNDLWITNYIMVEIFHHLQRNILFRETFRHYNELQKCKLYQIKKQQVDDAILTKLRPFCNHQTGNPSIGLVDATSLYVMDIVKVPYILSFDDGFDHYPFSPRIGNVSDVEQKLKKWN
ncbi:MAG: PIN domain-containing protein [Bacteroidota bacterium]